MKEKRKNKKKTKTENDKDNHTVIFFKLTDYYKINDIYINHNNWLGHMLIT